MLSTPALASADNTLLSFIILHTIIILLFHLSYSNKGSGVYDISVGNNEVIKAYCRMTSVSGCSGGGWTLVMKIHGASVSLRADLMTMLLRTRAQNIIV